ncbi:sensor histidine kinase [Streptomyces filamentosus]|uniref:histidine kinase n=1 Tax=Streptomyces filamentosus TaxID=67294 RepID=A0A919BHL2_STRFL|nr:sensor histidine kinase [Streptomyces filamentosus]KAA6219088.1 sensor histidine kinase [Streptomyces filamentosus]GHF89718.1 histidine kinase [Streptomyces filamentosus]
MDSPLVPSALRAPFQGRTWRAFLFTLVGLPLSVLAFSLAVSLTSLGVGLLITFLGIPVLAVSLAVSRGLGAVERARVRGLLGVDVPAPAPVRGRTGGAFSWMTAMLRSGASWRHLLYAFAHFPWAVFSFSVSVSFFTWGWGLFTYPVWRWVFPAYLGQDGIQLYGDETRALYVDSPFEVGAACLVGLVFVLLWPPLLRGLTAVDRLLVTGLLGPGRLARRVTELESDRGVAVDTAAADLRRIERELHDGPQARLASLAMDLGLAKEKLAGDPEAAAVLVDEAHGEVKLALKELRDLARGIHPAVLTDRGLDAALSSVAGRSAVPVAVTVDLPGRPVAAIEGLAYFTVVELLRNVSEHARARRASVDVWRSEDRLMLQVRDDGAGGADPARGRGLAGLAERLRSVDGVLAVDSPEGGPTTVTAELPWRA